MLSNWYYFLNWHVIMLSVSDFGRSILNIFWSYSLLNLSLNCNCLIRRLNNYFFLNYLLYFLNLWLFWLVIRYFYLLLNSFDFRRSWDNYFSFYNLLNYFSFWLSW